MNHYHIAVIPGDGIGKEITPEGLRVLQKAADITQRFRLETETFPWGADYYADHGRMMASDGLERLQAFDAIYFGAVGWPAVPDHIALRGLRLAICQGFDQYVCLRPALLLPGIPSPLAGKSPGDIDFLVVRENSEGEYSGAGGRAHRGHSIEVGLETAVFTRVGVERVQRYAFELARTRPRKKLSCVTKSNAQQFGFVLWDEVFAELCADYPEVETDKILVDAMSARFILHPESLDVVVASNLHGDVLTDIAGAICGSLGMAPSANINPERAYPSMFEPTHGSAPDIYGKGIANPIAMIWCGAMMLEFLGETETAGLIVEAIQRVTANRQALTPDLGGAGTTRSVTDAILAALGSL